MGNNEPTPTSQAGSPASHQHHAPSTPLARTRPRAPASASPQLKLRPRLLAARAVGKLLPLDLPPWPRSLFDIDGDPLSESCRIGLRYEQRSRMPAPRHPRRRTILTSTAAPVLGELQSAGSA